MKVTIVGNGVAGVTAARALRERDASSEITIFAAEQYHYYPRPWLIDFLAGASPQNAGTFYADDWYRERRIGVQLGNAVRSIDSARHEVELADGTRQKYDKLLLANGARPNIPAIEGSDQTGVFALRTLDDAIAIRAFARPNGRAVVIGGGLLGLESARALKELGCQVSVLQRGPHLLPAQLDPEGAEFLQQKIAELGITIVLEATTKRLVGNGTVNAVELDDGRQLPADLVLFSTGVISNIDVARSAGLAVNRGVVVNKYLLTSATDIYAAGDVAEVGGRVYGIIPAAIEQAKVAVTNLFNADESEYRDTIPANTLQVVGIDLTSVGQVNPPPETGFEEIRWKDESAGIYKKLVLRQGKAVGAIILGDKRSVPAASRLVRENTDVTEYKSRILQPNFDLKIAFK